MHIATELKDDQRPLASSAGDTRYAVSISIVVPCFNEEDGIDNLYDRIRLWGDSLGPQVVWECVLVDDGSTDGTVGAMHRIIGRDSRFRLQQHEYNRGLTEALATGFGSTRGRWVACLDADCTYDPMILTELFSLAESGFDVVTASPYHRQGRVENVAAWRIALSQLASRMYGWLFQSKLSCYTCCVRIYDADLLRECPKLTSTGFVGVTELLWQMDRLGARIGEVPAVLRPRVTGVSKMRTLRTALRHLRLMMRILRTQQRNVRK